MRDEKDYLEEAIETRCADDPQFARAWLPHALMLDLSAERVRLGLTQQEVADRMGVARPSIVRMENNPEGISLARIARYAEAVGATLRVVLGDGAAKEPNAGRGRPLAARSKRKAA